MIYLSRRGAVRVSTQNDGWESQSRFDVVHDASHVMHICMRSVGLVIGHLRVAQETERSCTKHWHGSRAMTVDTAAALQELHDRIAEIEEIINGSTERKVSGTMTRGSCSLNI